MRVMLGLAAVAGPVVAVDQAAAAFGAGFLGRCVIASVAGVLGYLAFVAVVERRRVVELRGPLALAEFGAGLGLGAGVLSAVIGSIWLAGGLEFQGWSVGPDLTYAAGLAIFAGVVEELALRGVIFRILEQAVGSWVALVLSAGVFGAIHLTNPGATAFAALAIALEAGVMLGAAFLLTRRLFLAMGLHMGWNFAQSGVFGVAVSGADVGGLLDSVAVGPDWISGGAFGAEASVLAVGWCGGLGVVLLMLAARRGHIRRAGFAVGGP